MKEDKTLLAGLDLANDRIQLSCFDWEKGEPVPLGRLLDGEREYEVPAVLAWNSRRREWFFGIQARQQAELGNAVLLQDIVKKAALGQEYICQGVEFSGEELLFRLLVKVLACLREYYPNERIRKLVISVEERTPSLLEVLGKVMGRLGIEEDRYIIQSHKQSYIYYALSQKRELWMNNVGLFEYGREGLFYSQITIDKRTLPYIVGVSRKDLTSLMDWDMLEEEKNLESTFSNIARNQLHKQMVTTVYITGEGFERPWAREALRRLCSGRRVFRGNNLFTRGACYAARELAGQGQMEEAIFLDEEMVSSTVSMKVYRDAQVQDIIIAKAGTPWREIDVSLDIIPDQEEEIQITTQNVLRRETKEHLLSLEAFAGRPNKMTRFTVRFRFADGDTCIVTLKDNGFGEFCPSSNRIWERSIHL